MKTLMTLLVLGSALATPVAANADWHEGYRGGEHHRDQGGIGAGGVVLGLAAIAGIAALAASASHDGERGGYAAAYGDGGGYAPTAGYPYAGYAPSGGYGAYGGYDDRGGYGGGYARAAVAQCVRGAVLQARNWSGDAAFGRIDAVDTHGDDARVRGTVRISGGYAREYATRGTYDGDLYGATHEVRFDCRFDDGRVAGLRVERPRRGWGE